MAAPKKRTLAFTTSVILSLSLFLFTVVFTLVKSAHMAALSTQKNIKLEMFFNENLSGETELAWISEIQSKPEIMKAHLISKEQAQLDFQNLMKNEWGNLVDEASLVGRLPASLVIEFQNATSAETRQKVADEILASAAQFESYDGSVFQKDWAQWFATYTQIAQKASWALGILIFSILYFIVSNLIRSQVFYKAEQIEILSFLGATHWQIQRPFIFQAFGIAVISTVFALSLLHYLIEVLKKNLLIQSQLFSPELIMAPSLLESLIFVGLVSVLSIWAARSCVQERLVS